MSESDMTISDDGKTASVDITLSAPGEELRGTMTADEQMRVIETLRDRETVIEVATYFAMMMCYEEWSEMECPTTFGAMLSSAEVAAGAANSITEAVKAESPDDWPENLAPVEFFAFVIECIADQPLPNWDATQDEVDEFDELIRSDLDDDEHGAEANG